MNWIKSNAHILLVTVATVGVIATTLATAGAPLLPTTVAGVLSAVGSVITAAVAALAGGKIAALHRKG